MNIVEIATPALPGEVTDANNRAVATVDGVRENLRVLLVSGEPHNGERTWRNLLKSDAAVDLVHFTILRPPEKQDGTPINELSLIAFPTRELFVDKVNEFDLIILTATSTAMCCRSSITITSHNMWRMAAPCWSQPARNMQAKCRLPVRRFIAPCLPCRPGP